jgi:phytoene desaturase
MSKKVVIIGAGVGGLATACILAQSGYDVSIYEKNNQPGGRAGIFKANGFTFDTGPSWYLMPEIFEHFFELLGEDVNKLLKPQRLSPSYKVFFKDSLLGTTTITGDPALDRKTLNAIEPGAAAKLDTYLAKAEEQYVIATKQFLYKNYDSLTDFLTPQMLTQGLKMNVFSSMDSYVSRYFTTAELRKIMQYHLVFLGASPKNAPALYNIMSHVDFNQGVYYPKNGIHSLTKTLVKLAKNRGVSIHLNQPVKEIASNGYNATGVVLADGTSVPADVVISNADMAHTELSLLGQSDRSYSKRYFDKRTLAPSALLLYLGVDKTYANLEHHNLVFSKNWKANFDAIFKTKKWPHDPSFYVCNPNKTDAKLAPKGSENLFVLVPLPATTRYTQKELETYAEWILETMEKTMHLRGLRKHITYKKIYAAKDFEADYNSLQGSALGFAHTLKQTAVFRPNNVSKKLSNLYYVGANTVPGIGLPMCLISAELIYKRLTDDTSAGPLAKL